MSLASWVVVWSRQQLVCCWLVRPDFCSWTGLEASPRSMGYWGGWKIPWCRMKSPPWMSRGMWWFLGWENVGGFSQNHGTWLKNGFLKWKVPFLILAFVCLVGDVLLSMNVNHNFWPPLKGKMFVIFSHHRFEANLSTKVLFKHRGKEHVKKNVDGFQKAGKNWGKKPTLNSERRTFFSLFYTLIH